MWVLFAVLVVCFSACLSINTALALDYKEAEHARISDEIEQMVGRQLWIGVEKKFQELLQMEADAGVELMTFEDLVYGAYAARGQGRMLDARIRLARAVKLDAPIDRQREISDWLDSIKSNFGPVTLIAHNSRSVALAADLMPLDPDQRIAIEMAIEQINRTGTFTGLLPRGTYTFAGHSFRVEPGIAITIETSPRLKKTTGEIVRETTEPLTTP